MRAIPFGRTVAVIGMFGSPVLCWAVDCDDGSSNLITWFFDLLVAGAGVAVAVIGFRIKRRMDERGLDFEKDQALIRWASEVLDTMAKCIGLTFCDPGRMATGAFFDERRALLAALSAQIDQGRLMFSNDLIPGVGDDKESAFRGLRPEVLTEIVFAHQTTKSLSTAAVASGNGTDEREGCRRKLVASKRRFVSIVQGEMRTKWRTEAVSEKPASGDSA